MTLGKIIKSYRIEHDLSMDSFSEKSGISKAYISLLEKNKHPKTGKSIAPSIQCIKQAAYGMDMDFNDLFSMLDGDVSLEENTKNLKKSILAPQIIQLLKRLRKTSGLSANEVVSELKAYDIDISAKTLYGYESGLSMLNADAFVALCRIYKCDNPMDIFGTPSISSSEFHLIEKYRTLDPHGKDMVNMVLNKEAARIEELEKAPSQNVTPMHVMSYYQRMASAGRGEYLFDDIPTDLIEVEDTPLSRRADFVLGVNGRSMEPTYNDGDKVLVRKTSDVPVGQIGVFIVEGKCYIKELGKDRLISHNEDKETYPDIFPDEGGIDIVGEVLGKV